MKQFFGNITKFFREVFYLERINTRRCNYDGMDTTSTIIENKSKEEK